MSVTKAVGNMYPWVTHCHSFLRGQCPHKCTYCYAKEAIRGHASRQEGPLRIEWSELEEHIPRGAVVFREHKNDLFADGVPEQWIEAAMEKAQKDFVRGVRNVWQTKNPQRLLQYEDYFLEGDMVGTTIESDEFMPTFSDAPIPYMRADAMCYMPQHVIRFVTIEPIMRFNLGNLVRMIAPVHPEFVNIGADSKGHGLPEPTEIEVLDLIHSLRNRGMNVRIKRNLRRLAPSLPEEVLS